MRFDMDIGSFELVPEWNRKVSALVKGQIAGIGSDKQDHIYVLTRSHPAVIILDKDANVLKCWDDQLFSRPHGVHVIDGKAIYIVDDAGHAAYQFTTDFTPVRTFGTKDQPSDTGCINKDWKTIVRAAGPFNYPTDVTSDEEGNLYFTDGYGNARVHVFSPEGELKYSFGTPGSADGQFNLPHGILYHNGILYVADRQNNRIQLFDKQGNHLASWGNLIRPAGICVAPDGYFYVAECSHCTTFDSSASRVSILSSDGKIAGRLDTGCGDEKGSSYHTAHGITVDSEGSIYIGEVGKNYPAGYVGTQKYRRV